MPITPLHGFPASTVYLLTYRYLHGLAFFLATFLIDIEPVLYMIFGVPQPRIPLLFGGYTPTGLHMVTHNPFAVIVLVAPAMTVLAKLLEVGKPFWLDILGGAEWIDYSWARVYLSALAGGFLHLGWDLTMHTDINLGFPFMSLPNPFVNYAVLAIIGMASVVLILPSYFLGKRINRGSPFKKLP
jgi:hypothetical protein